ncbi:FAR-17a/AIG1-like protein [Phanerochaete sordida]|uniref:FAR-17a/AIG1-like protein n=1 Tax=Phanerochaete sordida TaxID=48140 RepID=A0A9P3GHN1_9APHY|nr:FAR-17a/AIG1-like protein [Phanerochaete sordida]
MATFKPAAVVLHTAAAAIMTYAWFELDHLPNNAFVEKQKGGHFQFLTIQGLVVAWVTMVLSLSADLFPSVEVIRKAKRAVFMIAMPLATVISTIYWGLLLFMPHLILRAPEKGEWQPQVPSDDVPDLLRVPIKLDLALHAVPGTALILDFFLFEVKYAKHTARYGGAIVAAIASFWYSCWVEYCASYNGTFPYPFLTFNPLSIRIAIYAGASTFAYLIFQVLNWVHS